jgi:photosystem II stability/assembly factor-like uncharacterized protein
LVSDHLETIYVSNDGKIYIGTAEEGGFSVSTDGGRTWQNKKTKDGLGHNNVRAVLAVGETIYVGTDNGLSISNDGGRTWTTKRDSEGMPNNYIRCVVVKRGKTIVGTRSGLVISNDGQNWRKSEQIGNKWIEWIALGAGDKVYTATRQGFYVSNDNGETWRKSEQMADKRINSVFAVEGTNKVFIGTAEGLHTSEDGGETWTVKPISDVRAVFVTEN